MAEHAENDARYEAVVIVPLGDGADVFVAVHGPCGERLLVTQVCHLDTLARLATEHECRTTSAPDAAQHSPVQPHGAEGGRVMAAENDALAQAWELAMLDLRHRIAARGIPQKYASRVYFELTMTPNPFIGLADGKWCPECGQETPCRTLRAALQPPEHIGHLSREELRQRALDYDEEAENDLRLRETHGLTHAPLPKGTYLDPGFCAGCDAERPSPDTEGGA